MAGPVQGSTRGTLAGSDDPPVSRRMLVKNGRMMVRNGRMVTTDNKDCCCGPGGCDPYPTCVAYEHGSLTTGSTTTAWPCGLKLPASGTKRVTANAHIRGRRADWNSGGNAADITAYELGGRVPPAMRDAIVGILCPKWNAADGGGCLSLKEFIGDATLALDYRGNYPGGDIPAGGGVVKVVVHVTTDGKRWRIRLTPKTDGAIVRYYNNLPVWTDPRKFIGLEFAGGIDAGQCDGTMGVRDHASKLIIEGIDSGAYTDDAKYWFQMLVPSEIEGPDNDLNPDLTCKLPSSIRCNQVLSGTVYSTQAIPIAYTWRMTTRSRMTYEQKGYSLRSDSSVYLSDETYQDLQFSADMIGRTCEENCDGVVDPAFPSRTRSIEAGSTWTFNAAVDTRTTYRENGSVIDHFDRSGAYTTLWIGRTFDTIGSNSWGLSNWCQNPPGLNGTGYPPAVNPGQPSVSQISQTKIGYYAGVSGWLVPPSTGPDITKPRSQLTGTDVFASSSSNSIFTWAITLGRQFSSRTHYELNTFGNNGSYSKTVYDFDMTVELTPLEVTCAGSAPVQLPTESDARRRLAAFFGRPQ